MRAPARPPLTSRAGPLVGAVAQRVEQKIQGKKVEQVINRIRVSEPAPRAGGGAGRSPSIPQSVLDRRAAQAGAGGGGAASSSAAAARSSTDLPDAEGGAVKTQKDLQEEQGGAVYANGAQRHNAPRSICLKVA